MTSLRFTAALLAGAAFAGPALSEAHGGDNPMVGGAEMFADRTIVENAVNSADHTTLVAAVKAADLVETLSGEGPFTVFAPTNAAFEALPEGTVETLLMPQNKEALATVLTCHVAAANATAEAIGGMIADDGGMHVVPTAGGCEVEARMEGDTVVLTDERGGEATVTIADVMQSNGVIHVIDAVLLPAEDKLELTQAAAGETGSNSSMTTDSTDAGMADTMASEEAGAEMSENTNPTVGGAEMFADRTIIENAVNSPEHTTLVAAVQQAGLAETLSGEGPFTVFAPTDAAFAALPDGTVETLMQDGNRDQLGKILTAHVVPGRMTAADLTAGLSGDAFKNLQTVSGDALSVQKTASGEVFVFDENGNAYRVTTADVMQSNGVIHVIDGVLLPR